MRESTPCGFGTMIFEILGLVAANRKPSFR
jgi:hypothetical protein